MLNIFFTEIIPFFVHKQIYIKSALCAYRRYFRKKTEKRVKISERRKRAMSKRSRRALEKSGERILFIIFRLYLQLL